MFGRSHLPSGCSWKGDGGPGLAEGGKEEHRLKRKKQNHLLFRHPKCDLFLVLFL